MSTRRPISISLDAGLAIPGGTRHFLLDTGAWLPYDAVNNWEGLNYG